MRFDVFICHASEDKDEFVRPLAEQLTALGIRVWYDEFALKVGDSLRKSIDRGLKDSRHAIVVFSPAFFRKKWTEWELSGLVQRHLAEDGTLILPIWHNVTSKDLAQYSPSIADIVAIKSSAGISAIAEQLGELVSPVETSSDYPTISKAAESSTKSATEISQFRHTVDEVVSGLHGYACRHIGAEPSSPMLQFSMYFFTGTNDDITLGRVPVGRNDESRTESFAYHRESSVFGFTFSRPDCRFLTINDTAAMTDAIFARTGLATDVRSLCIIPINVAIGEGTRDFRHRLLGFLVMESDQVGFFSRRRQKFLSDFAPLCNYVLQPILSLAHRTIYAEDD